MSKGKILIVDDEANARTALQELLREEGYDVASAADPFKALGKIEETIPEVVLTDVRMPGMDGISFMEKVRANWPDVVFVVMTAFGSIDAAVEAVKRGAENYLQKPLDLAVLSAVVERAFEKARLLREMQSLRSRLKEKYAFANIIGDHPSMQELLKVVGQVAPSRASVLIHGESGTGKELIAAAIHQNSPRANGPFVKLNCASLAESLLESELFGHEKGSFTGAMGRREGRFKQADGGTLFLDEISEIPMGTQVKLLRFLQEREFERVGGNETLRVDVRIVSATNKNLKAEVASGRFREDLFFRLNVVGVQIPALRTRRSDIPALAMFFVTRFADENGKKFEGISAEALSRLLAYDWPGNVRELENAVERAIVMAPSGGLIRPEHLPQIVSATRTDEGIRIPGSTLAEIERVAILKTLETVGGSTSKAAVMLGISPRKIQYRLQEYREGRPGTDEEEEEPRPQAAERSG